jgi:hypothetical protein
MGHRFVTISDFQNNMASELKSIPAAEFCGRIQKLYDCANRCTELGEMHVEGYRVIKLFCRDFDFLLM